MPIINTIQIGIEVVLEQNVSWAMPIIATQGFCETEVMSLEVSMESDPLGTWLPLPDGVGSMGEFFSAAPFIRCTHAAGRSVMLRRPNLS